MAYSEKLNLIFVHIPKCAGTSIIEAMVNIDPSTKHGHNSWNFYKNLNSTYSFSIVRNPWDRVVSCYNYAKMDSSYWHGTNKIYGEHPDYKLANSLSFKDLIKLFYKNKFLLNYPAYRRTHFRHNWDRQVPYIYDYDLNLKVSDLYRFEDLDKVIPELCKRFNLDILHINKSNIDNVDYKSFYDEETKNMIYDIYREDIDVLNYSF